MPRNDRKDILSLNGLQIQLRALFGTYRGLPLAWVFDAFTTPTQRPLFRLVNTIYTSTELLDLEPSYVRWLPFHE